MNLQCCMINIDEIIELFCPDEEDEIYSYISEYRQLMRHWLRDHELDHNQLQRLMIIGFWFKYRNL